MKGQVYFELRVRDLYNVMYDCHKLSHTPMTLYYIFVTSHIITYHIEGYRKF